MATTEQLRVVATWDGRDLEKGSKRATTEMDRFRSAVALASRALGGIGFALAARQAIQYADAVTQARNRVRLFTGSQDEANEVLAELFKRANAVRVSLTATATLYQRLAQANANLGLEQNRMLRVMDLINKTVQTSGVSAESASAGVIQLGQALASGELRGEELRSVMEQLPALAAQLAAGMNLTVGEFREAAFAGEVTAARIVEALEKQAEIIDRDFANIDATVGQAFTVLNNKVLEFVGNVDDATGASKGLAGGLLEVADNLDAIAKALEVIAALAALRGVQAVLTSAAAGGKVAGAARAVAGAAGGTVGSLATPAVFGYEATQHFAGLFNQPQQQGNRTFFPDGNGGYAPFQPQGPVQFNQARGLGGRGAFQMAGTTTTAADPFEELWREMLKSGRDVLFEGQSSLPEVSTGFTRSRAFDRGILPPSFEDDLEMAERGMAELVDEMDPLARINNELRIGMEGLADAELDQIRKQRDLQTAVRGAAQILAQVNPLLGNLASIIGTLAIGGPGSGITAAIGGIGLVVDQLLTAGEGHDRYREKIREMEQAMKEATRGLEDIILAMGGEFSEEMQRIQYEALRPLIDGFRRLRQSREGEDLIVTLRGATEELERLDQFMKDSPGFAGLVDIDEVLGGPLGQELRAAGYASVQAFVDSVRFAFGDTVDFSGLATEMFDVRDAFLGVEDGAQAAAKALDRSARIMFDVEEIALRSSAQAQFAQAGSDPFARSQVFNRLGDSIEALADRERAATRAARGTQVDRTISGDPPPGAAKTAGGGLTVPGPQVDPTAVTSYEQLFQFESPALLPNVTVGIYGLDTSSTDMIRLLRRTIDDWSDLFRFPGLPRMLAPITVGIWGQYHGQRDMIRLLRRTIDDWSDLFRFPSLPPMLAPITVGVQGLAEGPRDLIRLHRLAIDDWSDMLHFPALPAQLAPINVGINGHPLHAPDNRTLIAINRLRIDDWSDLLIFPALPPPIIIPIDSLIRIEGRPRKLSIHDLVDMSELRGIITDVNSRNQRDRIIDDGANINPQLGRVS